MILFFFSLQQNFILFYCCYYAEKEHEGKKGGKAKESKGPQIKNSWLNICFHIKKIKQKRKKALRAGRRRDGISISRKRFREWRKINIYSLFENLFSKITSRGNKKFHTARARAMVSLTVSESRSGTENIPKLCAATRMNHKRISISFPKWV